jgi:hypothetical protein
LLGFWGIIFAKRLGHPRRLMKRPGKAGNVDIPEKMSKKFDSFLKNRI